LITKKARPFLKKGGLFAQGVFIKKSKNTSHGPPQITPPPETATVLFGSDFAY
jgi:hypothetical protein